MGAVALLLVALVLLFVWIVCGSRGRSILVTVVLGTIVVITVFVAVPSVLRTRRYIRESLPLPNLRTINAAEATYLSKTGRYGTMTDLIAASLLDDTFSGTKADYNYSVTLAETGLHYTAEAVPLSTRGGRYGYSMGPDGEVRYSTNPSLAPTPAQAGKDTRPVFPRRVPPAPSR